MASLKAGDFEGSSAQLRPEFIFPCEGRSMHINPAIQQHLINLLTAFLLPFNPHACMLRGLCTAIWPTMESNVFMPTSCGHGVDSITTASAFEICMRTLERCIRRLVLARLSQLGNPQSSPRMAGLNSACRQRRRKKGVVLSHHTAAQPPLFWPALQTHNHRRLLCQVRSDQLHIVTTSR